jgi:hypothetical protein
VQDDFKITEEMIGSKLKKLKDGKALNRWYRAEDID